jgi:hypothetical protein
VIAHSHGGNVVQYALSQPSVEACVHGCVFLGTPFISTRCRNFKLFLDTVVFHLTWLIPFVVLSVMFLVLGLSLMGSIGVSLSVLWISFASLSLPGLLPPGSTGYWLSRERWERDGGTMHQFPKPLTEPDFSIFPGLPIPLRAIHDRMKDFLLTRLSALQEDFRRYVTPVALNRPSLVCYTKRDEAGWCDPGHRN